MPHKRTPQAEAAQKEHNQLRFYAVQAQLLLTQRALGRTDIGIIVPEHANRAIAYLEDVAANGSDVAGSTATEFWEGVASRAADAAATGNSYARR